MGSKLSDWEIFIFGIVLLGGIVFIISPDLIGSEDKKEDKKTNK